MSDLVILADRWGLKRRNLGRGGYFGSCPSCGYPRAFKLSEGKEGRIFGYCASCEDHAAIAREIAEALGNDRPTADLRPDDGAKAAQVAKKVARAEKLWLQSQPAAGTLAETYLAARGLRDLATSPTLRYHPDCKALDGSRHPALIARVSAPDGSFQALHRTFLRHDGAGKADLDEPRASLGPIAGGVIQLHPGGETLVIGEGIETSASAGQLIGAPSWAGIAAGNLSKIDLPAMARTVIIAVDHDPPGIRSAKAAARRWVREGRRVRMALPDRAGVDFNDLLMEGR